MKTMTGLKFKVGFLLEKRKDKKVNAILMEDVPIFMTVSWNGERIFYPIGHRTDADLWVDRTKEGDPLPYVQKNTVNKARDTAATINASIRDHQSVVEEIFHETGRIYPSREEMKILINKKTGKLNKLKTMEGDSLFDYFRLYIEDADVSSIRKQNLNTTMKHLQSFLTDKKIPPVFANCTPQLISDFERYLREGRGLQRKVKSGMTPKIEKRSKNTVSVILSRLRSFFYYAEKELWYKNNPFKDFKVNRQVYGDPIFLTKEERDKLYYADLRESSLERARDIFLFQCFIGTRVGDLIKLKKDNVIDGTVKYIAEKSKSKSRRVITVPLTEKALAILEKYDVPNGDLLPYLSNPRYNADLKRLFKLVGINRRVVWLNPRTGKEEIRPLHEIAASHMARKTFVGLQFKAGVKNEVISRMSGHIDGSQAFRRYYNVDMEDLKFAIQTIE